MNELAEEKKKGNGRKRVSKQTESAKKEQQKGEESTPTDTGEGYVPAVTPSRKLLFSSLLVFITLCNKVEKVMFLHVSVCLSTGGSNWEGNPNWDKVDPQISAPIPGEETGTVGDGRHPTAMHSCSWCTHNVINQT